MEQGFHSDVLVWNERRESLGVLVIEDADIEYVRIMLSYMYSGMLAISSSNAMPLMVLANRFEITSLKDACAEYLIQTVNVSNCCTLLSLGDVHSSETLKDFCMAFLVKRFDQVSMSTGFLGIHIDVLSAIFMRDDLCSFYS